MSAQPIRETAGQVQAEAARQTQTAPKDQGAADRAAFQRAMGKAPKGAKAKKAAAGPGGEKAGGAATEAAPRRVNPPNWKERGQGVDSKRLEEARKREKDQIDQEWRELPESDAPPAGEEEEAPEPQAGEAGAEGEETSTEGAGEEPEPSESEKKGIAALSVKQLAAIRRAGTLQQVIDALSDDDLVALAEQEIERQKGVDAALSRQTDRAKPKDEQRETTASEAGESGGPKGGAAPEPPPAVDLGRVVRPLRESLGLDEEDGEKLEAAFGSVATSVAAAVREQMLGQLAPKLDEQARYLQSLEAERRQEAAASAMREAESRWPRLEDSKERAKVRSLAKELYEEGAFPPGLSHREQYERCIEDACYRVLGRPDISPTPRESRPRSEGASRPTPRQPAKPKRMKPKERDLAVFQAISRGEVKQGDRRGLERIAGNAG